MMLLWPFVVTFMKVMLTGMLVLAAVSLCGIVLVKLFFSEVFIALLRKLAFVFLLYVPGCVRRARFPVAPNIPVVWGRRSPLADADGNQTNTTGDSDSLLRSNSSWCQLLAQCPHLCTKDCSFRFLAAQEEEEEEKEETIAISSTAATTSPPSFTSTREVSPGHTFHPNIVLIVADDLGINDLSGGAGAPTPHIDSLRTGGLSFPTAYAAQATCAPSRAALYTGRYATKIGLEFTPTPAPFSRLLGVVGMSDSDLKPCKYHAKLARTVPSLANMALPRNATMLSEILSSAPFGYDTYFIGKWHLGENKPFRPLDRGFTESLCFLKGASLYGPRNKNSNKNSNSINISKRTPTSSDDGGSGEEIITVPLRGDHMDAFLVQNLDFSVSHNNGPDFAPSEYMTDYLSKQAAALIRQRYPGRSSSTNGSKSGSGSDGECDGGTPSTPGQERHHCEQQEEQIQQQQQQHSRPFFMTLAYNAPHTPLQALRSDYDSPLLRLETPRKSHGKEAATDTTSSIGISVNISDDDDDDKSKEFISSEQDKSEEEGIIRARVYAAMILALDRGVGLVIAALSDTLQLNNTLIVFTSDNGGAHTVGLPHVNKPYRGWKGTYFEGGLRVPLFMHWPAVIEPMSTSTSIASHIDIFPTIMAAVEAVNDAEVTTTTTSTTTSTGTASLPNSSTSSPPVYLQHVDGINLLSDVLYGSSHFLSQQTTTPSSISYSKTTDNDNSGSNSGGRPSTERSFKSSPSNATAGECLRDFVDEQQQQQPAIEHLTALYFTSTAAGGTTALSTITSTTTTSTHSAVNELTAGAQSQVSTTTNSKISSASKSMSASRRSTSESESESESEITYKSVAANSNMYRRHHPAAVRCALNKSGVLTCKQQQQQQQQQHTTAAVEVKVAAEKTAVKDEDCLSSSCTTGTHQTTLSIEPKEFPLNRNNLHLPQHQPQQQQQQQEQQQEQEQQQQQQQQEQEQEHKQAQDSRPAADRSLFWRSASYMSFLLLHKDMHWKIQLTTSSAAPPKVWVFDMQADPMEQRNLANTAGINASTLLLVETGGHLSSSSRAHRKGHLNTAQFSLAECSRHTQQNALAGETSSSSCVLSATDASRTYDESSSSSINSSNSSVNSDSQSSYRSNNSSYKEYDPSCLRCVILELYRQLIQENMQHSKPLWPAVLECPIPIDRTSAQREKVGEEFVYWSN